MYFSINNSTIYQNLLLEVFIELSEDAGHQFQILTNEQQQIYSVSQNYNQILKVPGAEQEKVYQQILKKLTVDCLMLDEQSVASQKVERNGVSYLSSIRCVFPTDSRLQKPALYRCDITLLKRQIYLISSRQVLRYNIYIFQNLQEERLEDECQRSQIAK